MFRMFCILWKYENPMPKFYKQESVENPWYFEIHAKKWMKTYHTLAISRFYFQNKVLFKPKYFFTFIENLNAQPINVEKTIRIAFYAQNKWLKIYKFLSYIFQYP